MESFPTPGVYRQDVFPPPAVELKTGVPAFLGFAGAAEGSGPYRFTRWSQFETELGAGAAGYLGAAVRGFFANGGRECYVVALADDGERAAAWSQGLAGLETLDDVDLVCAPDALRHYPDGDDLAAVLAIQRDVLAHCDARGDRFALLDALPDATAGEVVGQQRAELASVNGALYYPWVRPLGEQRFVPACGHVAGIVARTDETFGVHKAPANATVDAVVDLAAAVTDADQAELNPAGVNALRAFPGRGIRVWGARTLAPSGAPEWTYVNVRRLFLTVGRWVERHLTGLVFEPHDARLWARIGRELTAYLSVLFERGALQGRTPQEAFYVKCDAETNPPEVRDAGRVVTEIGLAPAAPGEIVVVRIVHGASGVTVEI